jgi:hypothetical protein
MQCFAVNFGFKPGKLVKVAYMGKPKGRTLDERASKCLLCQGGHGVRKVLNPNV